jgi:hypothetical protein
MQISSFKSDETEANPQGSTELQAETMPDPSQQLTKSSKVETDNVQIKKYHLLAFTSDLVAEQLMTDVLSGCAGQGVSRHPSDLFCPDQACHDPESFLRLKSQCTITIDI